MKALKTVGILLVLLIVLGLVASLILPKEVHVERSITINAPADVVWKYISSHGEMDKWSPWNKIDSNMTKETIGEDGTVGAIWKWQSDHKDVGNGEQEFTLINRDSGNVETDIRFEGMGTTKSWRRMSEGEDGVTVKWGVHFEAGIPGNLFMFIFGAEKNMIKTFDQGLEDLKKLCEEAKPEGPKKPEIEYEVTAGNFSKTTYLGSKDLVNWADMGTYMGTKLPAVFAAAGKNIVGPPVSIYWTWDEENQQTEMSSAIPVSIEEASGDFEILSLDSSKSLVIDYYGDYENMKSAHEYMMYHIESNNMEFKGPGVLEQYLTDPSQEPDTSKWHTQIIYFVK